MLDFSTWSSEAIAGVTLMSLLLVVIIVVAFMCIQAGIFHVINIQTKQPEFGELVVMYKCGRGPYSGSGMLFTEAHTLLPKYNTIGVYYDDPEKKSADNLRYIVGLVVAKDGASADPEDVALLESNGYKRVVLPAVKHAVVTDFPYCSTLSCIFAVFRVYPALKEYVERRELCAHPYLELYDSTSRRILFMGPLEQQDSFYVPDLSEENVASSPEEDNEECSSEEDGEGKGEELTPTADEEGSGTEGASVAAGSSLGGKDVSANWEQSASLLAEGARGDLAAPEAGSQQQGSAEESDTNTGSSFEEIDPSETASEPASEPASSEPPTTSESGSAGQAAASSAVAACSESAAAAQ